MSQSVGTASETDLGGKKLARKLAALVTRAGNLVADPVKTKRLKKATKQLKQFATKLARGLDSGKVNPEIGATLATLAAEVQSELAGLTTG
jgi:hypothetical protein